MSEKPEDVNDFNKIVDAAADFIKESFTKGSKLINTVNEVSMKSKAAKQQSEEASKSK